MVFRITGQYYHVYMWHYITPVRCTVLLIYSNVYC